MAWIRVLQLWFILYAHTPLHCIIFTENLTEKQTILRLKWEKNKLLVCLDDCFFVVHVTFNLLPCFENV